MKTNHEIINNYSNKEFSEFILSFNVCFECPEYSIKDCSMKCAEHLEHWLERDEENAL